MNETIQATVTDLRDGYAQRVETRGHTLAADEPTDLGGTDTGPTPSELLAASLGTCTAITVRMYARRKEWPLENLRVRVSLRKATLTEVPEREGDGGTVDLFEKQVELSGPLSDEQRARLLEIADRCPVHRTLTSNPVVRSTRPE